jgi:hypothetical protein
MSTQQFPWTVPDHDQKHIMFRPGCPECEARYGEKR